MPSPPNPGKPRTPYDVLDLPRTCSTDEIKKRYRELARKYHPDVNSDDPAAAHRFAEISDAYRTLSDADTRRTLDAEISLREKRAQAAADRAHQASVGNTSAYNARPRPSTPGAPPGTAPRGAAPAGAANSASESVRLTSEGRSAYNRDRPVEAKHLAEQALRHDRQNAAAWELLGDVFRRQGRLEESINAYSMSLQINPRNSSVMSRMERMARAAGPVRQSRSYYDTRSASPYPNERDPDGGFPGYSRPSHRASPPRSVRQSQLHDDKRPWGRLLVGLIGYGLSLLIVLVTAMNSDEMRREPPFPIPTVSHWNMGLIVSLGLIGLLLGATMTITGLIRRIEDELLLSGVSQRGTYLPLGPLTIVVACLNFYAAAVLYVIVTYLQESLTPSMLRVFGVITIAVSLMALAFSRDHWQVFLFGGNVVFLAFVIGWLLGDFFRGDLL